MYFTLMINGQWIGLEIYEWFWEERASESDGHQAHAFVHGLWVRPHWVRLAGGRPGYCLVGESYRENLVLVRLLCIYSSGLHIFHPCAITTNKSLASVSDFSIISLTMVFFDSTSQWRYGWWCQGRWRLVSIYWSWFPWSGVDPGVHNHIALP